MRSTLRRPARPTQRPAQRPAQRTTRHPVAHRASRAAAATAGALVLAVALTPAAPAAPAGPAAAAAAAPYTVLWSMSPTGSTVADPRSGLNLALVGRWTASGGGIRFGGAGVPSLGTSDDGGRLSPGTADFAVAVRLTSAPVPTGRGYSPNIVQKGLASHGGQWKLTLRPTDRGALAQCRFENAGSSFIVKDATGSAVDDGRSHDLACWREGSTIGVSVDGRATTSRRSTGSIVPRTPTTVANKQSTAGVEDQLDGTLSCVAVAVGAGSRATVLAAVGC